MDINAFENNWPEIGLKTWCSMLTLQRIFYWITYLTIIEKSGPLIEMAAIDLIFSVVSHVEYIYK